MTPEPEPILYAAMDDTDTLQPVTIQHVINVLEGRAPGHVLRSDMDAEAFAALPDCDHCGGTGKNLAGTPWDDQR